LENNKQNIEKKNMQNTCPVFSVVIPIYNEEGNIPELYRRLTEVLENLCKTEGHIGSVYEIIMVDDGSTDHSWELIKELHEKDLRVKGRSFSRNFGHHIAISAGLNYANGKSVILMDGDLQDLPEEIPKLYGKYKEGYDLVYGIRKERQDNIFRRISSFIFWKTIRALSGFDIPQNQAMLRIMNKNYVDNLNKFTERNRFFAGLFKWVGFNQTAVQIEHAKRFAGKSKYNFLKMLKLTFNAVTSFSYFPLQLAGFIGLFISVVAFIFGIWLILRKMLFGVDVVGWASTIVTILFIGGVQLAVLGFIGEYVGRVFSEVQQRPLYIIKEETDD
jgi:dolichol-phosphate mannosyltransferase